MTVRQVLSLSRLATGPATSAHRCGPALIHPVRTIYTSFADTPPHPEPKNAQHGPDFRFVKEWDPMACTAVKHDELVKHMARATATVETVTAQGDTKRVTVQVESTDPHDTEMIEKYLDGDSSPGYAGVVIEDGVPGHKDTL